MTYGLRSDVRFRVVGGEAVVIRQEAAEVVVLNEVGARILELVDRGADRAEMLGKLQQEFEVGEEELAVDVDGFLEELVRSEIVNRGGSR